MFYPRLLAGLLPSLVAFLAGAGALLGQQDWIDMNPFNPNLSLNGLVYHRDKFIGVGRNGVIMTAIDPVIPNWRFEASGTTDWLCAIASGRERVVVGRYNAAVPFLYSTDGRQWQPGTLTRPDGTPVQSLCSRRIATLDGRFLAVGAAAGEVATSDDGIRFVLQPQAGNGYPGGATSLCATREKFFVAIPGLVLLSTTDGKNWESKSLLEFGGDYAPYETISMASDGDQTLVLSSNAFFARSSDGGRTFTVRRSSEVGATHPGLNQIALASAGGVWVGFRSQPNDTGFTRSADGLEWGFERSYVDLFTPIQQIAAHPAGHFWAITGFSGVTIPPLVPSATRVHMGKRRPANATGPTAARLVNLSTRLRTGTGDNALIAGFALRGGAKDIVLRGLGPSLTAAGVTGVVPDPVLTLVDQRGPELAQMNDWEEDFYHRNALMASLLMPNSAPESGGYFSLGSGNYTALLRGRNETEGNCLVEVYDVEQGAPAALKNLSTRGPVGTGDRVLIAGFVVAGTGECRVAVRALGPSLSAFGVPNTLADPTIEIFQGPNLILSNDDWATGEVAALAQAGLTPPDPRESARVTSLAAGSYTVIVRGKAASTGNAIVEVYALD